MNFAESEEYLYSLGNEVEAMKLGLDNIRKLLNVLGHPEKKYLKVQIAGTNGKGSVCAFLNSICLEAGIKTGMFTSPHLVLVTERVKIDGVELTEDRFAAYATRVRDESVRLAAKGEIENIPTFFEQVTAIALLAFAEANVELAILETGLGGRFDAVTATNAEICAITRIDYDHQQYLGETLEGIAAEKAAIITIETQNVVLGMQSRPVMAFLRKHCRKLGIEPLNDEYEPWRLLPNEDGTVKVDLSLYDLPPIRLGLEGHHQFENAQTAIQIAKALLYHGLFLNFEDGEEEIRILQGLQKARHPGRLEWIGNFLLDGAHNVGGANALGAYLDVFVKNPITLIFGAMRDKNVGKMAEILWPRAKEVILTSPQNSRALRPEQLFEMRPDSFNELRLVFTDSVKEAIDHARTRTTDNETILITGSLYLVGEAQKLLTREDK